MFRVYLLVMSVCLFIGQVWAVGEMSFQAESAPTVTLDMREVPLVKILQEIERQAGVSFSYESSLMKAYRKVSIQVENVPVEKCLEQLFVPLSIQYNRTGNIIVLKRRPRRVTISGFVRDVHSDESLVGASVYDTNSLLGVATNNFGFFSLSLPTTQRNDGEAICLHVSYIGYESEQFMLHPFSGDTTLTVLLRPNATISEVLVTASGQGKQTLHNTQMGTMEVTQELVRATPSLLGEADVVRTLQLTPGVSVGTEGVSGLFVRGGNSDENLFLIDGNPVYQVNHLGGVFSAFNNEAIKSMHFYKAGFPARFGGRLSSVVDVQTKEGNMKEYHGSATLGLTSGNVNFEGPLWRDRTSFNIALRRTWLDVLSVPTLAIMNKRRKKNNAETFDFRYAFHDLNARIDHRFSDRSRMYVSLYNGNDVFHFTKKEYPTTESDNYDDCRKARMRWGNLVASAGWTYAFNNKLFGKLSGFYTRYHSKIAYAEESITGQQGDSDYRYIQDDTENRTGITDFGVRTAFDYQPVASHRIRFGADYLAHYFRPEYNRVGATDTDKPDSMQIARVFADDRLWAHEAALYAEDDWDISDAFRLNAGLRFSLFNVEGKTYTGWEPRLSLRYLVAPSLSLKASYSRMNQYVHQIRNSYLDLPTDSWLPVTRRLKPLTSDQFSVGAYYNWNRMLDFSVEGYYKRLDNLLEYKEGHSLVPSTVAWEDKMAVGDGRAYGVELMVRKPAGRLTGWVGYALSWADRQFPELNYGRRFPSRYDNRHKLNIVAMYKLSERIELSAAWTYSSGNMVTLSVENYLPGDDLHKPALPAGVGAFDSFEYGGTEVLNYYAGRNNYRLPAYHRLDLGLKIYRPLKKGRMGIWSVGLYNAYCRMNPVLVRKEYEYGGRAFKTLGFLPVVPSVSYTYKF